VENWVVCSHETAINSWSSGVKQLLRGLKLRRSITCGYRIGSVAHPWLRRWTPKYFMECAVIAEYCTFPNLPTLRSEQVRGTRNTSQSEMLEGKRLNKTNLNVRCADKTACHVFGPKHIHSLFIARQTQRHSVARPKSKPDRWICENVSDIWSYKVRFTYRRSSSYLRARRQTPGWKKWKYCVLRSFREAKGRMSEKEQRDSGVATNGDIITRVDLHPRATDKMRFVSSLCPRSRQRYDSARSFIMIFLHIVLSSTTSD